MSLLFAPISSAWGEETDLPRAASAHDPVLPPSSAAPPLEAAHPPDLGSHVPVQHPPLLPSALPDLVSGTLETERFRIHYTRRSAKAAELLAARIEPARDGLRGFLGRDWPGVTEVRLGADRQEMGRLTLPSSTAPSWAAAIAYPAHNIILLDATQLSGPEGMNTLWHELAHVALGRLGEEWPRWFQEGLAVHLTGSRFDPQRYTTLFGAVRGDRVLAFKDLTFSWPDRATEIQLAYAQSAAFVGWLHDRHGSAGMARLVDGVQAGEHFELAFAKAFSFTLESEEERWREGLAGTYGWLPATSITTLVLGFAALLTIWGWTRRRKQFAMRLAQMEAQEAAEDAARRVLEAELQAQELELVRLREGGLDDGLEGPGEGDRVSVEDDEDEDDDSGSSWPPRPLPPKPTLH